MDVRYIEMVVDDIGVPKHLKGYNQLCSMIECYAQNPGAKMMSVYEEVGRKFNVTKNSVERNLRHAVQWITRHGDIEKINNYFGSSMPTDMGICNSQFLVTLYIAAYRLERAKGGIYADNRR